MPFKWAEDLRSRACERSYCYLFFSFIARDHAKEKEKEEKFVGSFKEFWKSISTLLDSEKRELVKWETSS